MKYCPKCHAQLDDNDKFCLYCGMPQQGASQNPNESKNGYENSNPNWNNQNSNSGWNNQNTNSGWNNTNSNWKGPNNMQNASEEEGSLGGGICLGLFLGLIGLIISLFLKPRTKKGGIIGFCIGIGASVFFTIISTIVGGSILYSML